MSDITTPQTVPPKSGARREQFWAKATRFGFTKINKPKRKAKE